MAWAGGARRAQDQTQLSSGRGLRLGSEVGWIVDPDPPKNGELGSRIRLGWNL